MRAFLPVITMILIAVNGAAQSDVPKFDVSSIKPAAPGGRGMFIHPMPGGRVNITNMSLKMLIEIAYRVQPFQISGGPGWTESEHYDIVATPDHAVNQSDWPVMLQWLLADRFHLVFHRETRELPVYALVMARKDGKLGPGMTESKEGGCTPFDPNKPPLPPEAGKSMCGTRRMSLRSLTGFDLQIDDIVPMLSRMLGRRVINKTGLSGKFDMQMEFRPDESQIAMMAPAGSPPLPVPADASGPSLFTALQEQLGLKLESQKGPVEALVIDRAEKPSEN